jgi:diaminohydroxyphosphoribosylaminopyrimidine deaminase/5-amino-6-(5-phosphoribosylamino)uracil reductase
MDMRERFMLRCLDLAKMGMGSVSPNPMVGSVLVYEDKIVSEGYHQKYGGPHAEVNAINNLSDKSLLSKCTLYVNLEPCAHFGKTPPCSDLIIANNIPNVVIGSRDPFDQVDGRGIEKLKKAGINVTTGVLEDECYHLNRRFFTFHKKKRPYIILKWAQTANGLMSGGIDDPQMISGIDAQEWVHKWRSEEDAFMVGTGTVLEDNPKLNTRLWKGKDPIRVTIDRKLKIPETHYFLDNNSDTLIFTEKLSKKEKRTEWIPADLEYNFYKSFVSELYKRNIQSVVIEGGRILLKYFISEGAWDEARIFTSKKRIFNLGLKAPKLEKSVFEVIKLKEDYLSLYYNDSFGS